MAANFFFFLAYSTKYAIKPSPEISPPIPDLIATPAFFVRVASAPELVELGEFPPMLVEVPLLVGTTPAV